MSTSVTVEVRGPVAIVVFANPAQRGAFTPEMLVQVREHVRDLGGRYPQIRAVVLRGTGEHFSSGYAIDRIPDPDSLRIKDEIEELCAAIEECPVPVIAMLRGLVIGAALDVVAACDFRIADQDCRFGITPAKLGIVYTVNGTMRIHRLVGPDAARLLFYTGDLIGAQEALAMRLVTKVCAGPEELERDAIELAERIAQRAPFSVLAAKRIIGAIESGPHLLGERATEFHELRRRALRSADAIEARTAFAQKRPPRFTGEEVSQ